jgi:hypothetical protein
MSHDYSAPWSGGLRFATLFSVLLLTAAPLLGLNFGPHQFIAWRIFTLSIPLIALPLGVLFMVRGYRASPQGIEIERFGWTTQLPLTGLKSITADPLALAGSIRRWGNGGFFSITGIYSNARYGRFRAWATDPTRAVVLEFAEHSVILTPDDPRRFVQEVLHLARLSAPTAKAPG